MAAERTLYMLLLQKEVRYRRPATDAGVTTQTMQSGVGEGLRHRCTCHDFCDWNTGDSLNVWIVRTADCCAWYT
jgi:hypothetical protein